MKSRQPAVRKARKDQYPERKAAEPALRTLSPDTDAGLFITLFLPAADPKMSPDRHASSRPFMMSAEDGLRRQPRRIPSDRRGRASSDLLFLILDDPYRTRRALQLLLPVVLLLVTIVASFVVWAILQPDRAS